MFGNFRISTVFLTVISSLLVFNSCSISPEINGVDPAEASRFCQQHWQDNHISFPGNIHSGLAHEIKTFQSLAERSLVYRENTILEGRRLKAKIKQGHTLTGKDMEVLNEGLIDNLELRENVLNVARAHECWIGSEQETLDQAGLSRFEQLHGVMVSLAAALTLYDNYLLAYSLFEEDRKLRRILNTEDKGYDIGRQILRKIANNYNSVVIRARTRKAIRFYEKELQKYGTEINQIKEIKYLRLLIEQSPSYKIVKKWSPFYIIGRHLKFLGTLTTDLLDKLKTDGVSLFSTLFGNSIGLIESRKGKLYGQKQISYDIQIKLQPGDILLEKTPFRLTDALIPGHWGHAAVWVGTEKELKELNIWDHPVVKPHQNQISKNRGIVEALRSGVKMNNVDHFINVDDLAVLRHPNLNQSQQAAIIFRTLRQVGKAYDFNFDVETSDRLVCSELIYMSHISIQWPTQKTLGRSTISPDHIARKAILGGPLDLIILYHDGERIDDQPNRLLAKLIR